MLLEAVYRLSQTYYDITTGTTIVFKKLDKKHLLVAYSKEDREIKIVTMFILYIKFRDAEIKDTRMLIEDAYVDLDKVGNFVGLEIWKAPKTHTTNIKGYS
jgi:uncharacterized protein YuzE